MKRVFAPLSIGELVDKITILEIKKSKFSRSLSRSNVEKELSALMEIYVLANINIDTQLMNQLRKVNNYLWDIEEKIREKESINEFDKDFIMLARSVYKKNDERADLKKRINLEYGSELIEEKSYSNN